MLSINFRPGDKQKWEQTITKPAPKPRSSIKKRKKPQGRRKKKGPTSDSKCRKSVKFENTAIGHFLYVYAPIQYSLLIEYCRAVKCTNKAKIITPQVIETIALNSDNSAFRSIRFRLALMTYRRWGTRPIRPTNWTTKDAVYFARYSYKIYQTIK